MGLALLAMMNAETLAALIERELEAISDPRVVAHARELLVEPRPIPRDWDYGEPGQQYVCWTVVDDSRLSGVSIAYCEEGFGPAMPWGLVWDNEDNGTGRGSIGQDSGWFPTLREAIYDSVASAVPVWRIYKEAPDGSTLAISEEMDWERGWTRRDEVQATDLAARFHLDYVARDSFGRPLR
jgi:hypothetical protein